MSTTSPHKQNKTQEVLVEFVTVKLSLLDKHEVIVNCTYRILLGVGDDFMDSSITCLTPAHLCIFLVTPLCYTSGTFYSFFFFSFIILL